MTGETLNRAAARTMVVLSVLAMLLVTTGYFQAPLPDEGAAAHLFQISMLAIAAAFVVFLVTADWTQPLRRMKTLALPLVIVALAFAELYYLENVFYRVRYR